MYDPKYKMSHKPPSIKRLLTWRGHVPLMVGDPPIHAYGKNYWAMRCRVLYAHVMARKHGDVTRNNTTQGALVSRSLTEREHTHGLHHLLQRRDHG